MVHFLDLPYEIHYDHLLPLLHPVDIVSLAKTCRALHPALHSGSPYNLKEHRRVVKRFSSALRHLPEGGGDEDVGVRVAVTLLQGRFFSYEAYAHLEGDWPASPYVAALRSQSPRLLFTLLSGRFPFRWGDPGLGVNVGIGSTEAGAGGGGEGWGADPRWVEASMAVSARAERQIIHMALGGEVDRLVEAMCGEWSFRVNYLAPDLLGALRAITRGPKLSELLAGLRAGGLHPPGHMVYDALLRAATRDGDAGAMGRILRERRCTRAHGVDPAIQVIGQQGTCRTEWEVPTPTLLCSLRALTRSEWPPSTAGVDAALFYLCGPGIGAERVPVLEELMRTGMASVGSREHVLYIECHERPRARVLRALLHPPGEVSSRCLGRCIDLIGRRSIGDWKGDRECLRLLQDALFTPPSNEA